MLLFLQVLGENNFKNKINSYCVNYDDILYELNASGLQDLCKQIRERYKIDNNIELYLQYWSEKHMEWIFVDKLASENLKIKVLTEQKRKM